MERVLNYAEVRQHLKSVLDTAKSEHDSMMETYHLLRSPRNAERLRESIAEVEAGDVIAATLKDGGVEEAR